MSLLEFQTALGRALCTPSRRSEMLRNDLTGVDGYGIAHIIASPGFQFTVKVRQSWNAARARNGARLTLSILPPEERKRFLNEWVEAGGGTAYFFGAEADSFLEFIAKRLPDPSHSLSICRLEQATLRASEGSRCFTAPDLSRLDDQDCVVRRGRYAALVPFYAQPSLLMAALRGGPVPGTSPSAVCMLFGPAFEGLSREASDAEVRLWNRLKQPEGLPVLLQEGHRRDVVESLTVCGCTECLA